MTRTRNRPAKRPRRPDDMPSLIEEIEDTQEGAQEMAAAWLAVNIDAMLERALRARGMSQADLARALGVTEGRVSQILNSNGNLRVATIGKVFRALGFQARLELSPVPAVGGALSPRESPGESTGWRDLQLGDLLYRMDLEIAGLGPVTRSPEPSDSQRLMTTTGWPTRPAPTAIEGAPWHPVGATRKACA